MNYEVRQLCEAPAAATRTSRVKQCRSQNRVKPEKRWPKHALNSRRQCAGFNGVPQHLTHSAVHLSGRPASIFAPATASSTTSATARLGPLLLALACLLVLLSSLVVLLVLCPAIRLLLHVCRCLCLCLPSAPLSTRRCFLGVVLLLPHFPDWAESEADDAATAARCSWSSA